MTAYFGTIAFLIGRNPRKHQLVSSVPNRHGPHGPVV